MCHMAQYLNSSCTVIGIVVCMGMSVAVLLSVECSFSILLEKTRNKSQSLLLCRLDVLY